METELSFIKSSFSGGMNRRNDTTKIDASEYAICINARTRNNVVEPINTPMLQTSGLPTSGLYQGVYSAGSIVLVFVDGRAYYKDYNYPGTNFIQIEDLELSAAVPTIFAEFVPASTVNFARSSITLAGVEKPVALGANIAQTLQCVVVQDGVNQPWIIFSDGTARRAAAFNNWTITNREYVPIGKQMLYHNGILYIVSPNGTQIFRSVTGRPLDFVIAVDADGDKVGDAVVMSHAVDYGSITCIRPLNTDPSAIFVSTSYRSYMVIPDTTRTIYGEPTFNNVPLFTTGPLNQFSFIELLGDSAFITFSGMRSFNAVLQLKREGKNAPFSLEVSPFLDGILQNTTCAINYDDYGMFFVKTVHGDCILIYDTLQNKWSAIDKLNGIDSILQFCELKIQGVRKLFFITASGLYEYFGGTEFEQAGVYIGDYTTGAPNTPHKPVELNLVYTEPVESGVVNASIFTDALKGKLYQRFLGDSVPAQSSNRVFPFGNSANDRVKVLRFDIGRELTGWKLGAYISWAFNAKLAYTSLSTIPSINTEDRAKLPTKSVNISAILFNGQNILTQNLMLNGGAGGGAAAIIADIIEILSTLGIPGVTGTTVGLTDDVSFTWTIPPVGGDGDLTIEIIGDGTEDIHYIDLCGRRLFISGQTAKQIANGTMVGAAIVTITPEDQIFLNEHINGCPIVVGHGDGGGGTTVIPPITYTQPKPGITNATCFSLTYTTNFTTYTLPSGLKVYVLVVTPPGGVYTALLFTLNPDGSYKFITPLYQGNIDPATTGSISMMGDSFTFLHIVPFEINGKVFCVKAPTGPPPPPPPPPDPCYDLYPETLVWSYIIATTVVTVPFGYTPDPITLVKSDPAFPKYTASSSVSFDLGASTITCAVLTTVQKIAGEWVAKVEVTGAPAGTYMEGVVTLVAACDPPSNPYIPMNGDSVDLSCVGTLSLV